MIIIDILGKLQSSKAFKGWKKDHADYYLAHFFKMLDKENEDIWQIGYCSQKTNAIMSFLIEGNDVRPSEESKPFNVPGTTVKELNMEGVLIDWEEAMAFAVSKQKKDYPKELPLKVFFILQNIDGKMLYNITFFTQTFKALNIRICAENGDVVRDELNQFFNVSQ